MTEVLLRRRTVVTLAGAMAAVASAHALAPTKHLAEALGPLDLQADVPRQFGRWVMDERTVVSVVNPQQEELLKQLYSQVLERVYVNKDDGYRIMLTIAYGGDQREGLAAHYPEACYAAQGFRIGTSTPAEIEIDGNHIPIRQLETVLANERFEPITYWVMVGEVAVRGGIRKKLADLYYTSRGYIPDGLLFRVSSIDRNTPVAFERQAEFIKAILAAMSPAVQPRLAGTSLKESS